LSQIEFNSAILFKFNEWLDDHENIDFLNLIKSRILR